MKSHYMVRILIALCLVVISYYVIRTDGLNSAPTGGNDGRRVEISFAHGQLSTTPTIVAQVDNRGQVVLVSTTDTESLSQGARAVSSRSRGAPRTANGIPLWSSTASMSAQENAYAHWMKHGAEFPEYKTAHEYVEGARTFLSNPPAGTLTKMGADGDRLFFNPKDGTFGVQARGGAPRTMFRPDNGMEYWKRQ